MTVQPKDYPQNPYGSRFGSVKDLMNLNPHCSKCDNDWNELYNEVFEWDK